MKKFTKAIAVMLVVIMTITTLASCSVSKMGTVTNKDDNKATSISYKTYLFYAYYQKLTVDNYAAQNQTTSKELLATEAELAGKTQTYDAYFISSLKDQLRDLTIVLDQFNRKGLTLTAEDQKTIDDSMTSFKSSIGEAPYKKLRDALQMTEAKMRDFFVDEYKRTKLFNTLLGEGGEKATSAEEIKTYFDKNYARVKHILLKSQKAGENQQMVDLEGAELEAVKAKAEKLYEEAKLPGADFEKLARYNSEDGAGPDQATNTAPKEDSFMVSQDGSYVIENYGYTFPRNVMAKEFDAAAFEMANNEVRLVKTSFGWHIIKKYDLNGEAKIFETFKDALKGAVEKSKTTDIMTEYTTKYDIVLDDGLFEKYKLSNLKSLL